MCEHKIGSLMVFDGDNLKSIVTERDIMTAVSDKKDLATTTVGSSMPKNLITCELDHSLEQIMDLMINNDTGHRIRHLPAIDNGQFAGIVSIIDVIEQLLNESQFENQILKNYIKKWPEEASG